MQLELKVITTCSSEVVISDRQDINGLREMARCTRDHLYTLVRGTESMEYDRRRAFAMAQWILDNVPEST